MFCGLDSQVFCITRTSAVYLFVFSVSMLSLSISISIQYYHTNHLGQYF